MSRLYHLSLLACVCLLTANAAVVAQDSDDNVHPDRARVAAYRDGRALAPAKFLQIHAKPEAGQGATYRNDAGREWSMRVVAVDGDRCTVEYTELGTQVVLAVQFYRGGKLDRRVGRAWVGLRGEKPTEIGMEQDKLLAFGLAGGGRTETETEDFKDFDAGGMQWSGTVTTYRHFRKAADTMPHQVVRIWNSPDQWFQQALRRESKVADAEPAVSGLIRASREFPPLLDWSAHPAPTPEERKEFHARVARIYATAALESERDRKDVYEPFHGLHPNARVGDWAEYGDRRLVLTTLTARRAVIEQYDPKDEFGLVHAVEFAVENGKAGQPISHWIGQRGGPPQFMQRLTVIGGPVPALEISQPQEIELAGTKWQARSVKSTTNRGKFTETEETLISDTAPFAQPLKLRQTRSDRESEEVEYELTAFGSSIAPVLDWSGWRTWEAPFTAEQAKAFIKVGMKWQYRQELWEADGTKSVRTQDWEVVETSAEGYRIQGVLKAPGLPDEQLKDSIRWGAFDNRVELLTRGRISESSMKLDSGQEIRVLVFHSLTEFRDDLLGLSAELPGVRVQMEADLPNRRSTRITLTRFVHLPPAGD